jgi:F0F1-type ATP synthase assembly protein I
MAARCGNGRIEAAGTVSVERMDRLRLRGGSTAWALVGGQALTAVVAALVVWGGWGEAAALAALFGGFVVVLPTLYFAAKVTLAGATTAAEVLGTFYRAEVVKLVLTALLFWVGARWFGQHFAPLILTSIACLAMNWVMVAVTKSW